MVTSWNRNTNRDGLFVLFPVFNEASMLRVAAAIWLLLGNKPTREERLSSKDTKSLKA